MPKKIIVTGATGLIGKEVLPYLSDKGYEVYPISSHNQDDKSFHWLKCDLFDEVALKNVFSSIRPEFLINFAWITGGDYLTNPINYKYKDAGLNLLKIFKENGGKRAIYAGTCFEYDLNHSLINEKDKINPKTIYANCKNELNQNCKKYAIENKLSFGWGRIFYVFGHGEKSSRLTAGIINALKNNAEFNLSSPNNFLDYMYTKDIARAFVTFLESSYEGDLNICSGKGIFLKDYALKIQKILGKSGLIKYDEEKTAILDFIGDNTKLKSLGFIQEYDIDSALLEILKD